MKNFMKIIFDLSLVAMMSFSMAACGSTADESYEGEDSYVDDAED